MKNILFIDSAVDNYEILLEGLVLGITAIILDPNRDGVQQISQVLS